MIFRNTDAERAGIDPREELERFVLSNRAHIDQNSVNVTVGYELRAGDEDDWLIEFVRTQNPYIVLGACFAPGRLYQLAAARGWVSLDSRYKVRELVGRMLEALGFRKEIKPSGLFQLREELDPRLEPAEVNPHLFAEYPFGFASEMAEFMENLLHELFLFHSDMLRRRAEQKAADIGSLCDQYRKTRLRTLGCYIGLQPDKNKDKRGKRGFLTKLMDFVQEDAALVTHCDRYFQRIAPLNQNEIAAVGMFTIYRNLIIHSWNPEDFPQKRHDAETNLLSMDNNTLGEWEESWEQIVEAINCAEKNGSPKPALPKREMLQRMAIFFRQFLETLSQGTYPKVIVMQSYTVDNYGTCVVSAVDDAGDTVFLTDCNFEPFTEFYYISRTDRIGIEPIFVPKDELENWTTQPEDANESQ